MSLSHFSVSVSVSLSDGSGTLAEACKCSVMEIFRTSLVNADMSLLTDFICCFNFPMSR